AKNRAGIRIGRDHGRACVNHFLRAIEQFRNVHSLDGGGNHPKIGEGRITSSDARKTKENMAKMIGLGHFLHLRPRIRDSHELLSSIGRAYGLLHALEEILLEDIGFERASGLARYDEKSLRDVELAIDGADLRRVRRVEHQDLGETLNPAESHFQ